MESSGWKPSVEISPNCPRCGSCNTKFCYYNNYSLTQPRYFCKGCRRYWTKGGSLRHVPVGGGCRKNRRSHKSSFSSHSTPTHALPSSSTLPSNGDPSSSSSSLLHAPNIDLALVYANFLNPKPESTVPTTEVGPISYVSTLSQYDQILHGESQLMSEGDQMFSQGFNSVERNYQQDGIERSISSHDIMNFELPPLPGEEAALHDDMMWSNSALHATQSPLFGADDAQDANFFMDNWSHFDFPRP